MTISIASSAVQIDLNISVWTARKLDKKVSKEIDVTKGTTTQAGNYNKHLLAGTKQIKDITSLASEIRNWNAKQTLPWSDRGTRLLPMRNFFDYKTQLSEYECKFEEMVDEFIKDYPRLVSLMAFSLGDLFKRDDYPPVWAVKEKFSISHTIIPVPEAGDFRVDTELAVREELESQYEEAYKNKVESAVGHCWSKLHTTVEEMVSKLSDPRWEEEEAKNPQVYDSFLGNPLELTGLLSSLNITNDPDLEQARVKLEQALCGLTPNMVRKQPHVREKLMSEVKALQGLI